MWFLRCCSSLHTDVFLTQKSFVLLRTRVLITANLVEVTRAIDANPLALTRVQELLTLKVCYFFLGFGFGCVDLDLDLDAWIWIRIRIQFY